MKGKLLAVAAVAAVLCAPELARAGFYIGAHVGGGQASDTTIDNASGADHTISHDIGFDSGVAAGYDLPFIRMEAEVAVRNGDVHRIDGENAREGEFTAWSAMANLYLDFENRSDFTPFIGAGAGVLRLSIDDLRSDSVTIGDESDSTEAWQFMAGAAIRLDLRTSLDITCRYLDTRDLSWAGATADYSVTSLTIGLRYEF